MSGPWTKLCEILDIFYSLINVPHLICIQYQHASSRPRIFASSALLLLAQLDVGQWHASNGCRSVDDGPDQSTTGQVTFGGRANFHLEMCKSTVERCMC
jgi:hypothetical protein